MEAWGNGLVVVDNLEVFGWLEDGRVAIRGVLSMADQFCSGFRGGDWTFGLCSGQRQEQKE